MEPENLEKCKDIFDDISEHNGIRKVTNVKNILMEYLESVEEGTNKAKQVMDSKVGDTLDAANAQENYDCEEEGAIAHSDFLCVDPEGLSNTENIRKENLYRRIELYDDCTIENMTQMLDTEQRIVLDIAVDFARKIIKSKINKKALIKSPLVVVQGGAGTGKSHVIEVLTHWIEKLLRSPGDNPNHPYCVKLAFTGTAAANIKGQTIHSAFSFNFGNQFMSLGDKSRDEKRKCLENLIVVAIDEYSMIKSDMLYQLDLRLREVKQKPDLPFGGVGVILLGDILQLRPVRANYIMEMPKNKAFHLTYLSADLWEQFDIVMLTKNHRQGENKKYADILNRIREEKLTEDDIKILETRVRPINHPDIPKDALIVTSTNAEINRINQEMLDTLAGEEFVIEAENRSYTQKIVKSYTDNSGAIRNTPLQKTLRLKIGAKLMLTYNIDTCDSLTNGTFGEVLGFEFDKTGKVSRVIVHFYDNDSGKNKRKNHLQIQRRFPGKNATPIEMIEFQYCLSRKSNSVIANAAATQFPLRLAFAATAHKVQGQTVKKPNFLVVDLRSVREAAQAYVMLSRVQELSQIFILVSVCAERIYSSSKALKELDRMISICKDKQKYKTFLICCNIRSLSRHFTQLRTSPSVHDAAVICLQETWLDPKFDYSAHFEFEDMRKFVNSVGPGKGIVTYSKHEYSLEKNIQTSHYQITKITSATLDIINIYRSSSDVSSSCLIMDLSSLFNKNKKTLLVGDLNICFINERQHKILIEIEKHGFKQQVKYPTHSAGRQIDHVYYFSPSEDTPSLEVEQVGQFFTDHDMLIVKQPTKQVIRVEFVCFYNIQILLGL